MSSGGELAFIALHGVVKFLDTVFWVFGKGLIASALAVVGFVARAILGEDAREPTLCAPRSATGATRGRRRDEALSDLLSLPPDRRVSEAAKGDAKKLRDKHAGWCEWYVEHDVSTILDRAKPAFEIVKAHYPHAFHATTKQGFAVQLEKPGQFPRLLAELRKRGFADPTRAVVEHVSFIMSHAFDKIDARAFPRGRILRIVDMSRLDLSDTGYEAYVFLKAMAHVSSVAFPERVHKVVIVNPPAAFNALWAVFSPMVSARTMARVRICKDTQSAREALLEDLDLRDIPREYGGECDCGKRRRRRSGKSGAARDGGGARLRDCPSAACASCWRDAPLERELWDRVRASNGGYQHTRGGVVGLSKRDFLSDDEGENRVSRIETDAAAREDGSGSNSGDVRDAKRTRRRPARAASVGRDGALSDGRTNANANANASANGSSVNTGRGVTGSTARKTKPSRGVGASRGRLQSLARRAGDVETVRASAPPIFAAPRETPRAHPPERPAAADEAKDADGKSLGSWFF